MPLSVTRLADALQTLFTTAAQQAAQATGLVRRRRRLSGPDIVAALVFGWLDDPDASFETLADGLAVSPQALHQRLGNAAADCLRTLLEQAIGLALAASDAGPTLLARFAGVWLEDCTSLTLPEELAELFPGCGGSTPTAGRAGLKLFVRWDLAAGQLGALDPHPARTSDRTAHAAAAALPPGALRIADLGFYDGTVLNDDTARGVHWLTRLPTKLSLDAGRGYEALADFLGRQRAGQLDIGVRAGLNEPVPGRLLAWRCPPAVRRQRLARLRRRAAKLGRPISLSQRRLCGWTVLLTDLPAEKLTAAEAWALYRARWQVELLFKRWKGDGGLRRRRCRSGKRALCEVWAKLLGQVVSCWGQLLGGAPLAGASPAAKGRRVRRRAKRLRAALRNRRALRRILRELQAELRRLRPKRRRRKPSCRQILDSPELVT